MTEVCKRCGRTADEHHEFVALVRPLGCICDVNTWDQSIPEACGSFRGATGHYCLTCEHDQECHGAAR